MKGTYFLGLYLEQDKEMKIGALKEILFKKGYYVYVGSAMGEKGSSTLINRVNRYLKPLNEKKIHWHIDYFLSQGGYIINLCLIPSDKKLECELAFQLKLISDGFIQDFGSTDCKCESHLYIFNNGFPWS